MDAAANIRRITRLEKFLHWAAEKLYWYLEDLEDRKYGEVVWGKGPSGVPPYPKNVGRRRLTRRERVLIPFQAKLVQWEEAIGDRMWAKHEARRG